MHNPNRPIFRLILPLLFAVAAVLVGGGKVRAQKIVAALELDRKQPKPIWFEYTKKDQGMVTISYLVKHSSRNLGIFKYDADFKPVWNKPLFEQNGYRQLENMSVLGDNILVFVTDFDPKEKIYKTTFNQYSLDGAELAKEKMLYATDLGEKDRNLLSFTRSLNRKKLLAFHTYQRKGEKQKLQYFVFDQEPGDIPKGEIDFNFEDKDLQIKLVKISNEGNILVLAKYFIEGRSKNANNYTYLLFHYDVAVKRLKKIDLSIRDKFITDLTFKPDRDENILIAGFYSNKSSSQVIGVLYARIENYGDSLAVKNFQPFSSSFLSNYLSTKQIEKGRELSDFYLDDIILRSDGGVMLLAEQYYTTNSSYRDVYGVWYSREIHHYDDIIIVSVSADGKIEWASVVSKDQSSEYTDEMSYLNLVSNEQLYLLYKTRQKGVGLNVFVTPVGYDGKVGIAKPFFEDFTTGDVFYRDFSEQVSNNEAIVAYYHSRNKTFSLLKLAF